MESTQHSQNKTTATQTGLMSSKSLDTLDSIEYEVRDRRFQQIMGRAGIPMRYAKKGFEDYQADGDGRAKKLAFCEEYAREFEQNRTIGKSLVFCGDTGTGKTHLAIAIIRAIAKHYAFTLDKPVSCKFTKAAEMLRTIKSTYDRSSKFTESEAISTFVFPDLLVVDEVGVQYGSESEKIILFDIINGRYEALKPTILISNLDADGVREFVGDRVLDRMRENGGAVLAFDWGSYRTKAQ